MRIAVRADHGGIPLNEVAIAELRRLVHDVVDLGTHDPSQADDYPDYAAAVAEELISGRCERGLLIDESASAKSSCLDDQYDHCAEVNTWRISMSAPLLNHGRIAAFLIEGTQKAQVLREVLLGSRDPERLPVQLISPRGKLLWMVDTAAADLVPHAREKRSA